MKITGGGDHVLIGVSDPFPKNKNVNQAVLEKCRGESRVRVKEAIDRCYTGAI